MGSIDLIGYRNKMTTTIPHEYLLLCHDDDRMKYIQLQANLQIEIRNVSNHILQA